MLFKTKSDRLIEIKKSDYIDDTTFYKQIYDLKSKPNDNNKSPRGSIEKIFSLINKKLCK